MSHFGAIFLKVPIIYKYTKFYLATKHTNMLMAIQINKQVKYTFNRGVYTSICINIIVLNIFTNSGKLGNELY